MIAIISGSARTNSNTLKVAKAIKKLIDPSINVEIINFEGYDVPNFNQPFNPQNLSPWQQNAIDHLSNAKLIFWLSPEYNWLPSAELVQFINRFGGADFLPIWNNKVMATVGISAGIGGRLPAVTLKNVLDKVISYLKASSFTLSSIQEVHNTPKVMTAEGNLLDQTFFNASFESFVQEAVATLK